MSVVKITKDNFEQATTSEKPVLLDFYADWCGPCRMVSPIVDKIADEHPEFFVGKINVDDEEELARAFEIRNIPTLVVLKGGQVADKAIGVRTEEQIISMLEG
ncbi:MAG: thioredoxin [Clostridia bacterium]|nr:thioredoxin [Clostridia bacterium]